MNLTKQKTVLIKELKPFIANILADVDYQGLVEADVMNANVSLVMTKFSQALDQIALTAREEAIKENQRVQGLSALLNFIRNKARTDIMKADEYGQGYYQAIRDLEEYFGISAVDRLIELREKQK